MNPIPLNMSLATGILAFGTGNFESEFQGFNLTPPLWTDLVKMSSRKLRHASSFSFECTDFKNVIFENIHWAHSEDTENPK